jgi:hypothetical protein
MMKEIQLTQGKVALVDDEDYEWLNQWKWYCAKGYACRGGKRDGKAIQVYMHREIIKTPDGMYTDHINLNRSDNRKINLRTCTLTQNICNRNLQCNNTSGYRGVAWHKANKKWVAVIAVNRNKIYLGSFFDAKEAAIVYNKAAIKYFGEFACTNDNVI